MEAQNGAAEHGESMAAARGGTEQASGDDTTSHLGNHVFKITLNGTEAMGRNRAAIQKSRAWGRDCQCNEEYTEVLK